MLIISIVVNTLVVGYISSLAKKRFSVWMYIFMALIGTLAGALLSFGDSLLFLEYPFLNIWTVPATFSLLFALVAIFTDRGKMVPTIISILIILVSIGGIVYMDSSPSEYSGLFREEISRAAKERVGQPVEGFSAHMYLEAFPGLTTEDFDGVETLEGEYNFDGAELIYKRTSNQPTTSAEDVITDVGYRKLLSNLSSRFEIGVENDVDVATVLEKIKEGDLKKSSYISKDFSIWYPEGWYPHKDSTGVTITHDESLDVPTNTEGFAIGPYIQIFVETLDVESGETRTLSDMFERNLWVEGSEFLRSKTEARINGLELTRIVATAAGAEADVLYYFFYEEGERIITLSHYPYNPGSQDTDDFERAVSTFMPNYAGEGAGTATSADNAPEGSMHNLPVPDAVAAVRSLSATLNDVGDGEVIVMSAFEKTWSNGCLELAESGEMCTEALVDGYEVTVQVKGKESVFHTNSDGSVIRKR